jgi:protein-tyrosine-phosphatase
MMSSVVIQYICRGNAFRSIIAEAYTSSLGLLGVTALSSGTHASRYREINAEIFPKTLALLQRHGISQYVKDHYADDLDQELLDKSDVAIFLNRIVYEEAIASFKLPEKFFIWEVTDIGEEGRIATTRAEREAFSEDVYIEIVNKVDDFVKLIELRS